MAEPKKIRISTVAKKLDVSNTDVLHICRQELGIDPKAASSSITEEEAVAVGEHVLAEKARQDAVAEIEAEAEIEKSTPDAPITEGESIGKPSLMNELGKLLPPEIADVVLREYVGLSTRTATAKTAGAKAYPSQLRTGAGKILAAMGIDPAAMKAIDRQIRIESGGKK